MTEVVTNDRATGSVSYQGFLGKFFLAKPRSSSGYALAADKKQLRLGAGRHRHVSTTYGVARCTDASSQLSAWQACHHMSTV